MKRNSTIIGTSFFLGLLLLYSISNSAGITYQWSEEVVVDASFDFKISYSVDGKPAIDSDNNLEDGTNCFVEINLSNIENIAWQINNQTFDIAINPNAMGTVSRGFS